MGNRRKSKAEKLLSSCFICDACKESFTRKDNLIRHIKVKNHVHYAIKLSKEIEESLPNISQYPFTAIESSRKHFKISLSTVADEASLQKWVQEFAEKNRCHYIRKKKIRSRNTYLYYCKHHPNSGVKPSSKESMGTGCRSSIFAIVNQTEPEHTIIRINFNHNHPLTASKKVKFNKPSQEVEDRFLELFNTGLPPIGALKKYREDVREKFESNAEYTEFISDRTNFPGYYWVWSLHKRMFLEKYESQDIAAFINDLNGEFIDQVVSFERYDERNFSIAIASPFMKRVAESKFAGEMLFLDSTGSVDKHGLKVFSMLCETNAGGAPMGMFITTSETTESITNGLNLLLKLYNENSFGGRGLIGPCVVITDDSATEIAALQAVFPDSIHILSTFHVSQAWLSWLKKKTEHKHVFFEMKKMMNAKTHDDLEFQWSKIYSENKKDMQLMQFLRDTYDKREKWALCYRNENMRIRGNDTNNIVEHSVRVLKENVLSRIKAQCPAQLVSYIMNEYSQHYVTKFLECVTEKISMNYLKCKTLTSSEIDNYEFQLFRSLEKPEYSCVRVINKKKNVAYNINLEAGVCSCYTGRTGANCKHQQILSMSSNFEHLLPSLILAKKKQLYYIATGNYDSPENLLAPLLIAENESCSLKDGLSIKSPEEYILEEEIEFSCEIVTASENNSSENEYFEAHYSENDLNEDEHFDDSNSKNNFDENVKLENNDEYEDNDNVLLEKFYINSQKFQNVISQNVSYFRKGIENFTSCLETALKTNSGCLDFLLSPRKSEMRLEKNIAVNRPAVQRKNARKNQKKLSALMRDGMKMKKKISIS